MGTRKKIGLSIVFDNETNSGIVNYIISFISGFNLLPDQNKPAITIFYSEKAPLQQIQETNYPYLTFQPLPTKRYSQKGIKWFINAVAFRLFKKHYFENTVPANQVDYIFPVFAFDYYYKKIKTKIHWLVDFNPYYFPHHYEDKGAGFRNWHSSVAKLTDDVVVSSYSSYEDYKKFYPEHKNKVHVVRFASMLPDFSDTDLLSLKNRYGISDPYFITPNQFWEHKNHIVILEALKKLKDQNKTINVVFTGSTKVSRGLGFQYDKLKDFVDRNNLNANVHFLGVIDRKEQLALMKGAEAIIQPSLFEGWSTLVEESKALQKNIILSDIPVHREQIEHNCTFFDPHSSDDLVEKIKTYLNTKPVPKDVNYEQFKQRFANDLLNIFR